MQRKEIKDRFCIKKTLTSAVVMILILLLFKYAVMLFSLFVYNEHASVNIEVCHKFSDYALLGALIFFFATLVHASIVF